MKRRTIEKVLNAKFDDFLKSISDEGLRERVKQNSIITGGCIASMLLREKVNDYDIYFRNGQVAFDVAKHYLALHNAGGTVTQTNGRIKIKLNSLGSLNNPDTLDESEMDDVFGTDNIVDAALTDAASKMAPEVSAQKPPYSPLFVSDNALSLTGDVQLIIRFFGEPEVIHESYDFVHCTNYWTSWDRKVVLNQPALESLITKELIYIGSRYPLCSIIRIRKFVARGWKCSAGQILKMALQLNELDLKDLSVLQDQLVGVDALYFMALLHALKQAQKDSPDKQFTPAYIIEIINRIFES
jgi:hypothetical protein